MGACLDTPQFSPEISPKLVAKNILIRHRCSDKVKINNKLECPETFYILKYYPKYYKNLALQVTRQHRLLSKIKRIKKLKRFTGLYQEKLPQKLWFNLLKDSRKDNEEMPEIIYNKMGDNSLIDMEYWKRINLQKMRFFYNIKHILVAIWRRKEKLIVPYDNFSYIPKHFAKYLWGMGRIKSMKIEVNDNNYNEMKWIIEKLNRNGSRCLCRLETLSLKLDAYHKNYQEFLQNKTFFSYVTELIFPRAFDPVYIGILQMSKNLKSLSCNFRHGIDENPEEYKNFLFSARLLPGLKSIQFENRGGGTKNCWEVFKPQICLRVLSLTLNADDLRKEGFFERNEEFVKHWDEIEELDTLEFQVLFATAKEIHFLRLFLTEILKKVRKLRSLKLQIWDLKDGFPEHALLRIEEISHLSESLEKFEYGFLMETFYYVLNFPKFDVSKMKSFRRLKELKFEHIDLSIEDIKKAVLLLQDNQAEGAILKVRIPLRKRNWLRETLQEIERIKKTNQDLKVIVCGELHTDNPLEILEMLCRDIQQQGVKKIKGLGVRLRFQNENYRMVLPLEKMSEVLDRFGQIPNLRVLVHNDWWDESECIKVGGKREFFADQYCEYR